MKSLSGAKSTRLYKQCFICREWSWDVCRSLGPPSRNPGRVDGVELCLHHGAHLDLYDAEILGFDLGLELLEDGSSALFEDLDRLAVSSLVLLALVDFGQALTEVVHELAHVGAEDTPHSGRQLNCRRLIRALEVVKEITDFGESLAGKLMLFDALTMRSRIIKLPNDPNCPSCGKEE